MSAHRFLLLAVLSWIVAGGAAPAGATPFTLAEPAVPLLPLFQGDHGDSDSDSDSGRKKHGGVPGLEAFVLQDFSVPDGGAVCLVGDCMPGTQDTVVFRLGVDAGSLSHLVVALRGHSVLGAGFVPDGGVPAGDAFLKRGAAIFDLESALGPGEESNALFVTFEAGTIAENGALKFLTSPRLDDDSDSHGKRWRKGKAHGDSDSFRKKVRRRLLRGADGDSDSARRKLFAAKVPTGGGLQVIPEPGTLALMAAGIGGLGLASRRRTRRG